VGIRVKYIEYILRTGRIMDTSWELVSASAQKGAQVGAVAGLLASPIAWVVLQQRPSPMRFFDVLPRGGSIGVVGGTLVGASIALGASMVLPTYDLEKWVKRAEEPENARLDQWAMLGAGVGALLSTPGPGSVLFTRAPWRFRIGGGVALGTSVMLSCFAASLHPAVAPNLHMVVPATMLPEPVINKRRKIASEKQAVANQTEVDAEETAGRERRKYRLRGWLGKDVPP
jgi:hypothetical protein